MAGTMDELLLQVKRIDEICAPSHTTALKYQQLLKDVYDSTGRTCRRQIGPLVELTILSMDDESIWEQLQTRNAPLLKLVEKALKRLKNKLVSSAPQSKAVGDNMAVQENQNEDTDDGADYESVDNAEDSVSGEEGVGDSDSDGDFDETRDDYNDTGSELDEEHAEDDASADEDGEGGGDEDDEEARMEAWLDREDELEMDRRYRIEKRGGDVDEDDEDIDGPEGDDLRFVRENLYDLSDADSDSDGEGDEEGGAAAYKFSDFFVADKSERRGSKKARGAASSKRASDRGAEDADGDSGSDFEGEDFDEEGDEEEEDEKEEHYEGSGSDDEEGDSAPAKKKTAAAAGASNKSASTANRREQMLGSQIELLEEELMAEKPWELRGEVRGGDRPENSFLSLHADIERTSKPAPIITQAFTSSLEEMIRRRVKEGNFSDVLPPAPKKDVDAEGAAEQELSQEKSKQGLGEVYAEEFLARSLNAQPEAVSKRLEQDRAEAQELFHKISRQLDALSHFHYTPRPVVADTKLKSLQPSASAVASLLLEDVTPVTMLGANASQLAPEQVLEKKRGIEGSYMAEEELTSEDRKRKRKASKAATKAKKVRAADEAMHTAAGAAGPTATAAKAREDNRALDEELRRDSRVTLTTAGPGGKKAPPAATGGTSYAKSSAFFSKLQQETSEKVKQKAAEKGTKPKLANPFKSSASAMKL